MSAYLPRFFKSAPRVFKMLASPYSSKQYAVNRGRGAGDVDKDRQLTKEANHVLRKNMSMEIEFYEFAVQRLLQQDRYGIVCANWEKSYYKTV